MYNTVRIFKVQELLQKEKDYRVLISSAASSTGLNALVLNTLLGNFALCAAFLAKWINTTRVSQVPLVTAVNFKSRAGRRVSHNMMLQWEKSTLICRRHGSRIHVQQLFEYILEQNLVL